MKATFEIKKASDGKFVFNLKAVNEQVILTSQTYRPKRAQKAASPLSGRMLILTSVTKKRLVAMGFCTFCFTRPTSR